MKIRTNPMTTKKIGTTKASARTCKADNNSKIPTVTPITFERLSPDSYMLTRHGTIINKVHHPPKKRLKSHRLSASPKKPIPTISKKTPQNKSVRLIFIRHHTPLKKEYATSNLPIPTLNIPLRQIQPTHLLQRDTTINTLAQMEFQSPLSSSAFLELDQ